jgi:hypothetical protein
MRLQILLVVLLLGCLLWVTAYDVAETALSSTLSRLPSFAGHEARD